MGMINVVDHVNRCYSNADGEIIQQQIRSHFLIGNKVIVSFKGIDSASSSFVNSAFIELLDDYSFDFIRSNLGFADSSKQINEMIKRRFDFEVNHRKNLMNV